MSTLHSQRHLSRRSCTCLCLCECVYVCVCVFIVCWQILSSVNVEHNDAALWSSEFSQLCWCVVACGSRLQTNTFVVILAASRLLLSTCVNNRLIPDSYCVSLWSHYAITIGCWLCLMSVKISFAFSQESVNTFLSCSGQIGGHLCQDNWRLRTSQSVLV